MCDLLAVVATMVMKAQLKMKSDDLFNRIFLTFHSQPFLDVAIVTERVIEVVRSFEKVTKIVVLQCFSIYVKYQVNAEKVTATSVFKDDLDLDSLDIVEICLQLEDEFGIQIPDAEADNIFSIADAVKYISGHPMAH
jgi:NADH dehydrogenase (ubiquinone) 1 alpha/beta subcomplex 1, acyl-carrier protein